MSKGLIAALAVLGAIVLVVLMVGGSVIATRNRLVTMDEAINGQWSQVENQTAETKRPHPEPCQYR